MKHYFAALLAAATFVSCTLQESYESVPEADPMDSVAEAGIPGKANVFVSDELAEMLEEAAQSGTLITKSSSLNSALEELGIARMYRLFPHAGEFEPRTRAEGLHRWYTVEYSDETPKTKAQNYMKTLPGFEIVEPVLRIKTDDFNDLSHELWGLENNTNPAIDINVIPVWNEFTVGSADVIVSVVDNGVDLNHEDLRDNCLTSGHYNAVDESNTIFPGDHGTHVAGTIAAVGNNGKGIVGVAGGDKANGKSGVKIMSCQIFKNTTSGTASGSSANAIKWGADHGAVISQNSWGYTFDNDGDGKITGEELKAALAVKTLASDKAAIDYFIKYAGCDNAGNQLPKSPMKGGVVIFAAGNDAITNAAPGEYEKVIAVGSIAMDGSKSSFSNYGPYVDICAPGTSIMSTIPNDQYAKMNGTSMACPHVSGVAALLVSYFGGPGFTNEMLKEKLLGSANKSAVSQAYQIGGLVDAYGAFVYGNDKAPKAVTDLEVSGRGNNIDLTWTASADEDGKAAYGFLVIYGTDKTKIENATYDNLNGVDYVTCAPNATAGQKVTFSVNKLEFEKEYFVKMLAYSYGRNYSAATEVKSATTTGNNAPIIEIQDEEEEYTLLPSETKTITLLITEPDSHELTVELIKGSDAEVITLSPEGLWKLTLKGKDAPEGSYVTTVVASDEYGLKATKEIKYTIHENTAPVKLSDPENVFLNGKGKEFTFDITKHINDADGETLKYEVEISNPKVAHVVVKTNTVIVTSLAFGSTDVTIKGSDARGESAQVSFKVLVKDPSDPVSVYPNPVIDFVNVSTLDEADAQISISNQTGKVVYNQTIKASAFEPARIDMSTYAPGIYSMNIAIDGKTYKKTVTKI